jgi:hypothetical protein
MNKEQLKTYIKKYLAKDVFFNIEIIDRKVYFSLYGFHNREVCFMEIPYKNRLDKKAIYTAIADLITSFDFSFRVTFDNTKDIYTFLEVEG